MNHRFFPCPAGLSCPHPWLWHSRTDSWWHHTVECQRSRTPGLLWNQDPLLWYLSCQVCQDILQGSLARWEHLWWNVSILNCDCTTHHDQCHSLLQGKVGGVFARCLTQHHKSYPRRNDRNSSFPPPRPCWCCCDTGSPGLRASCRDRQQRGRLGRDRQILQRQESRVLKRYTDTLRKIQFGKIQFRKI